jgi:hypothetical protein
MTHPILSRIPLLGKLVDERFLEHRMRSSSIAGLVGAFVAGGFFEYRFFHDKIVRWDLLIVLVTMAVVKMSLFAWYRFSE